MTTSAIIPVDTSILLPNTAIKLRFLLNVRLLLNLRSLLKIGPVSAPTSDPKRFMADDVPQGLPRSIVPLSTPTEPEAVTHEQVTQPALKAPRLDASDMSVNPLASSASELPRVLQPDARARAEQPSILTQPAQPEAAMAQ